MRRLSFFSTLFLMGSMSHADISMTSQMDYESTAYFADSKLSEVGNDERTNQSLAFRTELYGEVAESQTITFKPFVRWDENDDERSHFDVRELIWHKVADEYELKAGIGKVFWGVTESQHLVDIVNQTDVVESLDGEQKLGQPMVQLLLERDWGNLDLFILPYHRERTFVGPEGRLGLGLNYADAIYDSDNGESNIDVAARFYTYIDEFEYAVSLFHGTGREPVVGFDSSSNQLLPYYPTISQLGLEMQYLNEGWAWKFEGIVRDGMPESPQTGQPVVFDGVNLTVADSETYFATTAGFEYTQVGIWDTRIDLGWVVEHLYDSRQSDAPAGTFEHDALLATRWAANDAASSTLLAGVLVDYEDMDYALSFEGTTRVFESVIVSLEARIFAPSDDESPLWGFRDEDFVKLTFSYYL